MTNLSYSFFKTHFTSFKQHHQNGVHPECFYQDFFDEFILPEIDSLLTPEDKEEWVKEWQDALELEDEDAELEFHEIAEMFGTGEDVTDYLVENNESIKDKFIYQLYLHLTETWSDKQILNSVEQIQSK